MSRILQVTEGQAKRLLVVLLLAELVLAVLYAVDVWLVYPGRHLHPLVDFGAEANLASWFSSVQLFAVGVVFLLRARDCCPGEHPSRRLFHVLGGTFVFLSADEVASIHEKMTFGLGDIPWAHRLHLESIAWVAVYGLFAVVLALLTRRDWMALAACHRRGSRVLLAGVAVLLLAGVVIEVVGYQVPGIHSVWLLRKAGVAVKKLLVLAGGSVVLYAALLPEDGKCMDLEPPAPAG